MSDWVHNFYQQSFPTGEVVLPSSVSEATTVTTTPAPTQAQLSPEGRVSKPIRRRSRASRRTPTTLLNTDTTNFRAMVQQFTGGPTAPNHLGFGLGPRPTLMNPNGLMLVPSHEQHHMYQQHYTYRDVRGHGGDNMFFQRLSNPTGQNVREDGGVFMDDGGRYFPSSSS